MFFAGGAGAQRGRLFVQKALLAELVPRCSIEPRSSRAGPSCACLPAVPVRQTVPFAGLSCRIKRGAVHRCGHGCCAGTRALAHCNPALPLPRTTSTHGHALFADLEERVLLARRGTQPGAQFFHGNATQRGVFGKIFLRLAPGGARGDSFVRCHVKVIRLFRNFTSCTHAETATLHTEKTTAASTA